MYKYDLIFHFMNSDNDKLYFTPFNFLDKESKKRLIELYPYKNKDFFIDDYKKSKDLLIKLKKNLYKKLNTIHDVSYEPIYWDLIIEQWLFKTVMILRENWSCIEILNQEKIEPNFKMHNLDFKDVVHESPNQFFLGIYTGGQAALQNFFYLKIIKYFNFKNIILEDYTLLKKKKVISKKPIYLKIIYIISKFILLFKKNYKILILAPQHFKTEINSFLKNFIPYVLIDFSKIDIQYNNYNSKLREWNIEIDSNNDFEKFVAYLIPKILPKMMVEDYKKISNLVNKKYPIKTKNLIKPPDDNDYLNFFVANQVSMGSKIHMFQHGANYGQLLICPDEEIEFNQADYFYTYGWKSEFYNKEIQNKLVQFYPVSLGYVKNLELDKTKKELSIILKCNEEFFYQFQSVANYAHQKKYIDNIKNFQNRLKNEVIKNLSIRLHPTDKISRYKKSFDSIKIYDGKENIIQFLQKLKLCIITYNATTYLHTFALNIPTIIYFDKDDVLFRKNVDKYFNYLREANILFDEPNKAAEFINSIYPNVEKWWFSEKTQKNVKLFTKNFADLNKNNQNRYDSLIKNILKNEKNV